MPLIKYRTKSGNHLYIEVDQIKERSKGRVSVSTDAKEFIQESEVYIENSFSVIDSVTDSVVQTIKKSKIIPAEIELKIGLKLTGEANAIIAKTAMEGNIEVTIKWKNLDSDED